MSQNNAARMAECRKLIDEVIDTTEHAVDKIIHEVKKLQAWASGTEQQTSLGNVVEACSFQDLTGQRLKKIIKIIDQIEGKTPANATEERLKQESSGLLDGPSSNGKSQDEIDKLFGDK